MKSNLIYMDNAATSWPKPPEVMRAMSCALLKQGGNPGRGGHRLALAAGELLYQTRENAAKFFGCEDAFRLIFSQNITAAINLVLQGWLNEGDHVLVSPMEHNAVMRPLQALSRRGITWNVLPAAPDGRVDCARLPGMIRPQTRLIVICHESNVNGVIQPLREIGRIARQAGIFLLADCAQSAGHLPIDLEKDQIDFLCFTGHKGLMGPTGTGGVLFGSRVDPQTIRPLLQGGTGSLSESFEQPAFLPDRFEAGTQNLVGLAGLNAGINWLNQQGIEAVESREQRLMARLTACLSQIDGVTCYSAAQAAERGSVLSLTLNHLDNGIAGQRLDEEFGILSRIGLHCAPLAHQTIGSFPDGAIRFSVSPFTSVEDIENCIRAVTILAGQV